MTYLQIFADKRELIEQFPDADKGILLTAMMAYAFDGTEIDFGSSPAKYVWPVFREMIGASKAKCETNKRNASKDKATPSETERTGSESKRTNSETERIEANVSEQVATSSEPVAKSSEVVANRYINQESIYKNQESIINIINNNDNARTNAARYVSLNIPAMTEGNWEELRDYQESLPDDLICRAVDMAGSNGVLKWSYVSKILNNYVTSGIKTVAQAEAAEEARQKKASKAAEKPAKRKTVTEQQYHQRTYEDDSDKLPDWMVKALEEERISAVNDVKAGKITVDEALERSGASAEDLIEAGLLDVNTAVQKGIISAENAKLYIRSAS